MASKIPTENKTIRNIEILRTPFRNFNGDPTKFNAQGGQRYFNIRLDRALADEMRDDGWKVKELPPREEGDEPLWILNVKVNYDGARPPRIVKVTPAGKEPLTEEVVGLLDAADIEFGDIIIRPYSRPNREKGELPTAYLQTGFFHIKLDELELEYAMEDEDEVVCDEDGVCYRAGVRIN